ncbi:SusC/RagA family TonB-linked outer membrane protein [Dyadobacter beijingensis]|uniref:SusC/RagA family TonB-linked outer membrane protein n=1 Tax=Dyadobacter beijingensis TaxID=365489 RepID=A0ABQ2HS82_9BACT|nr:TonB-dependent receptor [Dyadobacter beijingensis]GGM90113.1 SusC/RagA family TonB-linked outer membrane protein [Dyadobacter beijingensis]
METLFTGKPVWWLGICMLLLTTPVFAQTITGSISDAGGGKLPGVSVVLKGTQKGTSSNADGAYSLAVSGPTSTLVFSYVGYVSQEIQVGDRTEINVTLAEDNKSLHEVVVVGYGTQEKKDLTGAISSIAAKDIVKTPVSGFDQALQGQVAGLQISSSSGAPGGNTNILIRGIGSISGGNEPLFVIDGFPVSGAGVGNPLNTISPNDIESIDVLKDASATAIYGSRGSNGVIIVTTKRGKSGKAQIQVDAYAGIQQIGHKIQMMNAEEFARFTIDGRNNGYLDNVPTGKITDPNSMRPATFRIPADLQNPAALGEGTDWQDAIFRNASIRNIQVAASGGNENVRYAISAGYFNQQGIIINTGLKRYSFRANADAKVSKRLTVGVSLLPSFTSQDNLPFSGHYGGFGIIQTAMGISPHVPVYRPDGSYGNEIPAPEGSAGFQSPVKIANEYKNPSSQFRLLGNTYAEFAISGSLKFRTTFGADLNYAKNQIWIPSTLSTSAPVGIASATATRSENINWLNENTLSYKKTFGKHTVDLVGGFTAQRERGDVITANAVNFPDNLIPNINGGTVNSGTEGIQDYTILSLLARANYIFNDRYLITATLRRDGSSRFGENNRWGTFPSASVGWRVSEEAFMKTQHFINDLKLRASYGLTGNNAIGNYRAIGQLTNANYVIGDALTPGLARSSFSNGQLGWESMKQLDLGLDLSVLDNRVNLTADLYEKRNTDMLFNISTPGATGLSNAVVNLGEVQNKGLELALMTRNTTGVFKWTTNANITFNRNKVLAMSTDAERIFSSANGQVANTHVTQVGSPIGVFFGRRQLGIFQTEQEIAEYKAQPLAKPGDVKWKDIDGNGVINDNDREVIGSPHAKYFFGFNNTFSYKNLSLDIATNGMVGYQIYDGTFMINNAGVQNNTKYVYDHRWISPEQPGDGRFGRTIRGGKNTNTVYSSQYLFNGSYLRIRNVTLAYSLPQTLTQRVGLQNVRIYATGTNLFTFTGYRGYDPEVSVSNDNLLASRSDFGNYPIARSFTIGINLSF